MECVCVSGELDLVPWQQNAALNPLIAGCRDAGRTYRKASRVASDAEHRKLLLGLSRRRAKFVDILSKLVDDQGGLPRRHGSMLAAVRRTLQSWTIALTGSDDGDTFRQCAEADARILRRYTNTLDRRGWPSEMRAIIHEQAREIETNHDQMRKLSVRP